MISTADVREAKASITMKPHIYSLIPASHVPLNRFVQARRITPLFLEIVSPISRRISGHFLRYPWWHFRCACNAFLTPGFIRPQNDRWESATAPRVLIRFGRWISPFERLLLDDVSLMTTYIASER